MGWDGSAKLELPANNTGFLYIQGGSSHDLTQDERRKLVGSMMVMWSSSI